MCVCGAIASEVECRYHLFCFSTRSSNPFPRDGAVFVLVPQASVVASLPTVTESEQLERITQLSGQLAEAKNRETELSGGMRDLREQIRDLEAVSAEGRGMGRGGWVGEWGRGGVGRMGGGGVGERKVWEGEEGWVNGERTVLGRVRPESEWRSVGLRSNLNDFACKIVETREVCVLCTCVCLAMTIQYKFCVPAGEPAAAEGPDCGDPAAAGGAYRLQTARGRGEPVDEGAAAARRRPRQVLAGAPAGGGGHRVGRGREEGGLWHRECGENE